MVVVIFLPGGLVQGGQRLAALFNHQIRNGRQQIAMPPARDLQNKETILWESKSGRQQALRRSAGTGRREPCIAENTVHAISASARTAQVNRPC
jgi:hypothetical protein